MNLGNKILQNIFKNKEVISASIVGSYTEKKNSCKLFFWSVKNFLRRIFASSFDDL